MRNLTLEVEDDGDKSLVIFDEPRDVSGTALLNYTHREGADDQWLYLPALRRVKRIASNNKSGPFMGSEFAYEDIASQEVAKYTYDFVGAETVDGVAMYVIERVPVDESSGYTRQIVWFDQAEYRLQKIDFYDRKNELLKTLTYVDYQRYLDRYWRVDRLEMVNHQTGKSTTLSFANYQFQTGLTDRDFDQSALRRARVSKAASKLVSISSGVRVGGVAVVAMAALFESCRVQAQDVFSGSVTVEGRWYPSGGLYPEQHDAFGSTVLEPELFWSTLDGAYAFTFAPYARLDGGDSQRTHFDIREAYWRTYGEAWDFEAGATQDLLGRDRVAASGRCREPDRSGREHGRGREARPTGSPWDLGSGLGHARSVPHAVVPGAHIPRSRGTVPLSAVDRRGRRRHRADAGRCGALVPIFRAARSGRLDLLWHVA